MQINIEQLQLLWLQGGVWPASLFFFYEVLSTWNHLKVQTSVHIISKSRQETRHGQGISRATIRCWDSDCALGRAVFLHFSICAIKTKILNSIASRDAARGGGAGGRLVQRSGGRPLPPGGGGGHQRGKNARFLFAKPSR